MAFSWFRKRDKAPKGMLPDGWHFFARPTSLEPPGTIFRIDGERRRFRVHKLDPAVDSGPEPGMRSFDTVDLRAGIVARLLGLETLGASGGGKQRKQVEFELKEPVRESTTEEAIDRVLKPYLSKMEIRKRNRYFVVRETRTATAMTYRITKELLGELGGEGAVDGLGELGLELSAGRSGVYDLCQEFPQRLAVMFLPEEIAPVGQGLGGDETELGRLPVTAPLEWTEGEE